MKFYQEYSYVLIAHLVIGAFSQVQGKNIEQSLTHKENSGEANFALSEQIKTESNSNLEYTRTQFPPPALRNYAKQPAAVSKIAKRSYPEINRKENINSNLSIQKVHCRQITKSETNKRGDIIDRIEHICSPSSSSTAGLSEGSTTRIKHFGNAAVVSSTPKGINCRRVMNSELNELGEIVDTVTVVCDPPTTTTTTTPKPTTPKTTTTTAKPLVKVCRPVMDSYLSKEGNIIDSVTLVCKMEPHN